MRQEEKGENGVNEDGGKKGEKRSQKKEQQHLSPVPVSIFKNDQHSSVPFKGLVNHGNCCYMNAVMQIFINLDLFPSNYHPLNTVTKYLFALKARYCSSTGPVDIKDFRDILNSLQQFFYNADEIYDTMDFLTILIDLLDEPIRNKFISLDDNNIEYKLFSIPLSMIDENTPLQTSIASLQLLKYPDTLIIETPRGTDDGFKNHGLVHFKELIAINERKYHLVAVLNHKGFEKDGHYTAKIKHTTELFYLVDEQSVEERRLEAGSRSVIALFYQLIQ